MKPQLKAPAPHPADGPPELYTGIQYEVDFILDELRVAFEIAKRLKSSFEARETVPLKLAAEQLAPRAERAASSSRHLASVLVRHLNRRPRP